MDSTEHVAENERRMSALRRSLRRAASGRSRPFPQRTLSDSNVSLTGRSIRQCHAPKIDEIGHFQTFAQSPQSPSTKDARARHSVGVRFWC